MPNQFSFTAPTIQTLNSTDAPESLAPFPPVIGRRRRLFPAQLTVAENCRFTEQGGVRIRGGAQNIYSLGTALKVDTIKGFETDNFAVLFVKSGTHIYQSNNPDGITPAFYDIGVTRTASQKDFPFVKRKDCIFMNPVDGELQIFTSVINAINAALTQVTVPTVDIDDFYLGKPLNFTAASSTFTATAHGMANGAIVTLFNIGGALPTGLAASTNYYVVNQSLNTFQLSATLGGTAIVTSDNGTGTSFYMVSGIFYVRGIQVTYQKPTTYTVNAATDVFTATAHGLANGATWVPSNIGGAVPAGLTAGGTYYVITATANTFQLSATLSGGVLDITDAGTGINTFIAEDGIIRNCVGLTSAMIATDIITQTTAYTSAVQKGSCMSELLGSCLIGGAKDPTALYNSLQSTAASPSAFYNFNDLAVAGDKLGPSNKPMPRDITALMAGTSVTLIGLKKGLVYAKGFDANSALLTTSLNVVHSIPNAQCIAQMDENFSILTGEGRILPVGQTNAGFKLIENPKNPHADLDYLVQGYLQANIDKKNTGNNFQHYDPGARTLSSCVRLTTGLTSEVILQTDVGAWSIDTTRSFSCKTIYKGRVYCGSDNTDIVYLQDSGLQDDISDIPFRIVTGQMNYAFSRISIDVMNITLNGLLSPIGQFVVNVYADQTLLTSITVTAAQLIAKGLMKTDAGHPIGGGQVGADRIGDGGKGIDVFDFVCPLEIMFECRKVQLEIISSDAIEIRNFDIPVENEGEELFDTL